MNKVLLLLLKRWLDTHASWLHRCHHLHRGISTTLTWHNGGKSWHTQRIIRTRTWPITRLDSHSAVHIQRYQSVSRAAFLPFNSCSCSSHKPVETPVHSRAVCSWTVDACQNGRLSGWLLWRRVRRGWVSRSWRVDTTTRRGVSKISMMPLLLSPVCAALVAAAFPVTQITLGKILPSRCHSHITERFRRFLLKFNGLYLYVRKISIFTISASIQYLKINNCHTAQLLVGSEQHGSNLYWFLKNSNNDLDLLRQCEHLKFSQQSFAPLLADEML